MMSVSCLVFLSVLIDEVVDVPAFIRLSVQPGYVLNVDAESHAFLTSLAVRRIGLADALFLFFLFLHIDSDLEGRGGFPPPQVIRISILM